MSCRNYFLFWKNKNTLTESFHTSHQGNPNWSTGPILDTQSEKNNAGDGTWTHTILRPQAPEACASANSATPAFLVLRLSCAAQQNIYYQMIPNLSTAFFKFFQKISNFLFCPEKPAIRRAFREILHHLDSRQEIAVSSAIPKKIQKSETLNTSLRNFSGPNRKLT